MDNSVLGSAFEISLRILILLNELHGETIDTQQICAIDFIAVYASDFDVLEENIHGYHNYRFSEYPARWKLVSSALKELVFDRRVRLNFTSTGYSYSITREGKRMCEKLTDSYADEYRAAVKAAINKFDLKDTETIIHKINILMMQSPKEVNNE